MRFAPQPGATHRHSDESVGGAVGASAAGARATRSPDDPPLARWALTAVALVFLTAFLVVPLACRPVQYIAESRLHPARERSIHLA